MNGKLGLMLIQICLNPLRLQLNTADGKIYQQELSPIQSESMALALLSNSSPALSQALSELLSRRPELLDPELLTAINETAAQYAARDRAALREMGVADATN